MYVSLDGVIEEPAWTAEFWNDELATYSTIDSLPATPFCWGG